MSDEPVWDGKTKVLLNAEQLQELYLSVPQWHGSFAGPSIPFGGGSRPRIIVETIFAKDRAGAEAEAREYIALACQMENAEYAEEQWQLEWLVAKNTC